MENEAKVILNPDQKAVALKSTKDLFFAVKQLHDWIAQDELTKEMAGILPNLIESHFTDVANKLDYNSKLIEEKEKRHQEIRRANTRIRELEKQLGEQKPVDGLSEQLEHLSRIISDWWDEHGFHHVSEPRFTSSGIFIAKFSFMLEYLNRYSDTPETDKQNRKQRIHELIEEGWDIISEDGGRSPKLVDNDNNRSRLVRLIKSRFPSAKIVRTRNWCTDDEDRFVYRDIEVYIYNLHDIPKQTEVE
ncbi:hypothetical protein ASL14_19240 [Paenibacillus sp. IHB B 3084]|uniref:hypothetical protein n=1 Tax=Paenibacillus sp. IHB B 3084 TaxID=867076 RepID=UPI0007200A1B|nr:hypothetical protein [Paenibacillus sp. IHB B 3084]ALP38006.1 hypothetical protein ASL14_19240 [Paenibacillus sp. IHB B 3084]